MPQSGSRKDKPFGAWFSEPPIEELNCTSHLYAMHKRPRGFVTETITKTRELLESEGLTPEVREEAERFLKETVERSEAEIADYDFFFEHMPSEEADETLIVLKAHLLIERKTWEFVRERLLTPDALEKASLNSHQLLRLAESLCLPNPEPQWLWNTARMLNKLRNKLAHNLQPKDIDREIASFTDTFAEKYPSNRSLSSCLAYLYAQVAALGDVAREPNFMVRGKCG